MKISDLYLDTQREHGISGETKSWLRDHGAAAPLPEPEELASYALELCAAELAGDSESEPDPRAAEKHQLALEKDYAALCECHEIRRLAYRGVIHISSHEALEISKAAAEVSFVDGCDRLAGIEDQIVQGALPRQETMFDSLAKQDGRLTQAELQDEAFRRTVRAYSY